MVWIGLVRPMVGYLLLAPCGPVWSKLSASEITLPFFTSPAAAMMSCGLVKLSVPTSSFGPHLPQFLYFSAASRRSCRVIFFVIKAPSPLASLFLQDCRLATSAATLPRSLPMIVSPIRMVEEDHEGFFACSRARICAARSARFLVLGSELSGSAGSADRPIRGGRANGCDRAARRAKGVGKLWAAGVHREYARGRRQYRDRDRRQG